MHFQSAPAASYAFRGGRWWLLSFFSHASFLFLVSLFLRKKTVVTVVHRDLEGSTRKELDQQFLVSLFLRKKTVVTVVHREGSTRKELGQQFKEHHKVVSFLQTRVKRNHQASVRSSPDDGASAHSVIVTKIPWKPFWLATQLCLPHNDRAGWQYRVNYVTYPQRPHRILHITLAAKLLWGNF